MEQLIEEPEYLFDTGLGIGPSGEDLPMATKEANLGPEILENRAFLGDSEL